MKPQSKPEPIVLKKAPLAAIVKWSTELNCPIYVLEDSRMFVPMTGKFAGFYEEVKDAAAKE